MNPPRKFAEHAAGGFFGGKAGKQKGQSRRERLETGDGPDLLGFFSAVATPISCHAPHAPAFCSVFKMLSRVSLAYLFLALLAYFHVAHSQIVITRPEAGAVFEASNGEVAIPIAWQDDGQVPTDDSISSYTFVICTGPNNAIYCLEKTPVIKASDLSENAYTPIFDADLAADGLYYVQIYAQLNSGGDMIRYTNRILLTGMTGSMAATGSGASPYGETNDEAAQDTSASFTVPYTAQTGKTRYAPMQMQPGSTVTATTWSRRFPSSAVTYYSTFRPNPEVLSTVTPGWSYTMSSLVNYATPAPFPSEVSWYPASNKLVSATLDSKLAGDSKRKLKKRRWID